MKTETALKVEVMDLLLKTLEFERQKYKDRA